MRDQARGKWRGILSGLGIDERCLSGKHTACPLCGGRDRFRFDDKEGRGTWFCNSCGAGDGFALLMKVHGIEFRDCAERVRQVLGVAEFVEPNRAQTDQQRRSKLRALWKASSAVQPDDIVDGYLSARGLKARPKTLRTVGSCRTSDGKYFPAMIALVHAPDGKAATIHRTYLTDEGKANIESPRELMSGKIPEGVAIRLAEAAPTMGIAEGIETALAASMLFDMPVWAAINAGLLEKWQPPEIACNIVIFGDNDNSFTGQKAAYTLAHRLAVKEYAVKVRIPDTLGRDWADELRKD